MTKSENILKLFGRRKQTDINYLELTPFRLYEHEAREESTINVLVPRFNDRLLGKILQPKLKNKYIKANFDKIGSAVWLEIDGQKNVDTIIQNMQDKWGDDIHPAYERVTMFLSQLHRNGFIDFQEFTKG